ncbi:MAG: CpsD/CapB family tyrosine-protein kinase [Planctomycetota bacterium]
MATKVDDLQLMIQKLCLRLGTALPSGSTGRAIAVTSAKAGEGKTFLACALAIQLARSGEGPVLLVDANFDRPAIHARLKIPVTPSLQDCLKDGSVDVDEFYRAENLPLAVLAAGEKCAPALLFHESRSREFLEEVRPKFSWIVFDTAALGRSGANSLLHAVDGVLLVVDSKSTRRQVVANELANLEIARERILGVVLNRKEYPVPSLIYKLT